VHPEKNRTPQQKHHYLSSSHSIPQNQNRGEIFRRETGAMQPEHASRRKHGQPRREPCPTACWGARIGCADMLGAKGARVRDCCPKACTPWRREASPGSPRWKLGTPLARRTYFVPGRRPVGGREHGRWKSTLRQQLSLAAMWHAWDTGGDRERCG
jgi:hypothetical protein